MPLFRDFKIVPDFWKRQNGNQKMKKMDRKYRPGDNQKTGLILFGFDSIEHLLVVETRNSVLCNFAE